MKFFEIEVFNIRRDFKSDGTYDLILKEPEIQRLTIKFDSILAYKEVEVEVGDMGFTFLEIETENGYYEFVDLSMDDMNKIMKHLTGTDVIKAKHIL